jgi:predicted ester cyclase
MIQRLVLVTFATLLAAGTSTAQQPADCRATTESEKVAIAKAWHEDVINNRKPETLARILAPKLVHHAAGGYPQEMNADQATAMMGDFLGAFPDLHYSFDHLFAKGDLVVERYTATGTQAGRLGTLPPTGRKATWTGINIFRIECGRITEIWSEVDALTRDKQLRGQ